MKLTIALATAFALTSTLARWLHDVQHGVTII